jgi:hypothetical protein
VRGALDGFVPADSATFFNETKDRLNARLDALRSQLGQFLVQKETDANATDQEKAAVV